MKIVVVATHNERFFDSFLDSCKKQNCQPIILGWGQEYTGHLMKDDLLEKYLQNNEKENEIILFCDAFDCIILRSLDELEKEFINSGKNLIVSTEKSENKFYNYFKNLYFGNQTDENINTGMIIGYKKTFLGLLSEVKKYRIDGINSNQKIWTQTFNYSPKIKDMNIHSDYENKFFKNYNIFSSGIKIIKKKIFLKDKNTYPYVLQGNGNLNLNKICNKLSIKKSKIKSSDKIKYYKAFYFYYVKPYQYYILTIIILLLIILYLAILHFD
jgi:hypothetical protein